MGENPPPFDKLYEFDDITPKSAKLPSSLNHHFNLVKTTLESMWEDTISASHPVSGLTVHEQLENYQILAHNFMAFAQEANQELWQEYATRDFLTGTWTRLKLQSCLSQALEYVKQHEVACSIVLLDQNKFKLINDEWGHVTGDEVLIKTAAIIERNLRPKDKLFRYGGDEWLILMPGANAMLAKTIIQRIAAQFEVHEFESKTGEAFKSTFSYGIGEAIAAKTTEEWISAADAQLYSHKSNG
jgi:diguanylate cyclase (GGDEF)-like protein